ncbi:MAG: hypothetical protein KAI73_06705 [Rhodospirillaceae bacterium]|nr:hypothetical protein [Rhodospirillaceae bacterium]
MPKTPLPIATGFYVSRSLPLAAQECINWYPTIVEGTALSDRTLFGTPGLREIATTGVDKQVNRGSHVKGGIAYFVNGTLLYRLNRTVGGGGDIFSIDALGVIPGSERVSMADNGTQLMILVPGGDGFIFDESAGTPFQQITDLDFTANGAPQHVVYIDGYFAITTDTKKFIVSALNDGLSYDALDFGTAEADPDDIVAPIVHSNQLFIGGSETIEVFQNIGGSGFPFQRVEGFVIPTGIKAAFSIVQAGETFMFIGAGVNDSPSIMQFTGTSAQIVSTDAIDFILQGFTEDEIAQSFAWSYSQSGAHFVGFSLPTTTLVYDQKSKEWHERRSQIIDASGTRNIRWRPNSLITAYGKVLVGDSEDGRIGEVDLDFFDEYDGEIIRRRATMPFSNDGNSFSMPMLELTMESGVGDFETEDPQIRLAFSKDGKTFSSELTRSIGKAGEFDKRIIWRRLGRFPRMSVFQFTMSAKVKPVIIKLEADIVGGTP